MSIKKFMIFNGTMEAISGIHVGGNSEGTKVGGCDNPVIKNPLTNEPYIPGSSIKGALRSALESTDEYKLKIIGGAPCRCGRKDCMVCKLFGAHMNTKAECGEPRLIVRDMNIDPDFKKQLIESGISLSDIIEIKTSNMKNRETGTANGDRALRSIERVAAGVKFKCQFVLKIHDGDSEKAMYDALIKAIKLVELNGVGGKVTAGCGHVKFDIDWENFDEVEL